jgi:hypothetical protein
VQANYRMKRDGVGHRFSWGLDTLPAVGSLARAPLAAACAGSLAGKCYSAPMPFRHPWTLVATARRFRVTIETDGSSRPQVAHVGTGRLRVEAHESASASTLIWHENGAWTLGPLAGIRFHNRTTWRRDAGRAALHLSHLRRGPSKPTFLATLRPGPDGVWVAEAPHACGSDLYIPSLEWRAGHLTLLWDVRSPVDPYVLRFEAWRDAA